MQKIKCNQMQCTCDTKLAFLFWLEKAILNSYMWRQSSNNWKISLTSRSNSFYATRVESMQMDTRFEHSDENISKLLDDKDSKNT